MCDTLYLSDKNLNFGNGRLPMDLTFWQNGSEIKFFFILKTTSTSTAEAVHVDHMWRQIDHNRVLFYHYTLFESLIIFFRNCRIPNWSHLFNVSIPIYVLFKWKTLRPSSQERCNLNSWITSCEIPIVHSSSALMGQ